MVLVAAAAGPATRSATAATEAAFAPAGLEEYIRRALAAHPRLAALEARHEAALQRVPQAAALPDPTFQVTHFVESVQTRTGPQEQAFALSQRLPWFGKRTGRQAVASAEAAALLHALRAEQLELARDVTLAYYEYGYTGKAIQLTAENLRLLEQLVPVVDEKVRSGGDLNALLRVRVETGKVADQLQSLRQARLAQAARLMELMGQPPAPEPLPFPEFAAPVDEAIDTRVLTAAIQSGNPRLALLRQRIAGAEARSDLARLENRPDVMLGLNYIRIGDSLASPAPADAGKDPWALTFSVNLPIWQGRNQAVRAEALANRRAAEHDHAGALNALRSEIAAAAAALEDAQRRVRLYGEELLPLARKAVKISRTSYQNGRAGILEVIDSERTSLDLELLRWRAAADALQQRAVIQSIVNQPFSGIQNSPSVP
jgi:outer membrane protein, heavy metal efflux system